MRQLSLGTVLVFAATVAHAQGLPSTPITALGGRLVVSGEVMATAGAEDDAAFFNYTDYEHNALRRIRVGVSAGLQPNWWLAFLGNVQFENFDYFTPYAAFVRVHPWRGHALDIQAGRIPPVFGAFGRRTYALDNPLIGYPLGYQYLTSLRATALPSRGDDLLRMRGRGWLSSFPVGDPEPGTGLPLVNGLRFDTGVQARWRTGTVEFAGAVTNGTLSNPRVSDDNGGKQVSGRVAWTPVVGLALGASAAAGAWVSDSVPIQATSRPLQRTFGADAEYSRAHWLVRSELVWSEWEVPFALTPPTGGSVSATAVWVEGRYRFTPRVFVAVRSDWLGFSNVQDTLFDGRPTTWDANVSRLEASVGYYFLRNLVARVTVQGNWRDGGRVRQRTYVAAQVTSWF